MQNNEKLRFISREAVLRKLVFFRDWQPHPGIYAHLDRPVEIGVGRYAVTDSRIVLLFENPLFFDLCDIGCVTTNSRYFVFRLNKGPGFQIKFLHEGPFQYQEWTRRVLRRYWESNGREDIKEFQPRLVFKPPHPRALPVMGSRPKIREKTLDNIAAFLLKSIFRILFSLFFRARVVNKHNIPLKGPCIFILNHVSYWDPFLAQSLLPRKIAFFAKNSEFAKPVIRYILKIMRAIPVKRYRIDPGAIRNARTWLDAGEAVGIFVEGERSWDGVPQSSKFGTVKFLLASGVPIVPVFIDGTFKVQPRWDSSVQLYRVKLVAGEPLLLDPQRHTFEEALKKIDRAVRG